MPCCVVRSPRQESVKNTANSGSFVCSNGIELISELQVAGSSNFGVDDEIEMLVGALESHFCPVSPPFGEHLIQAGFDLEMEATIRMVLIVAFPTCKQIRAWTAYNKTIRYCTSYQMAQVAQEICAGQKTNLKDHAMPL